MDVMEAIQTRRSVRKWLAQPVPDETVEKILDAGRWAPSAGNFQPWAFIVIRNPETKERIHKVAEEFEEFIPHLGTLFPGRRIERLHPGPATIAAGNRHLCGPTPRASAYGRGGRPYHRGVAGGDEHVAGGAFPGIGGMLLEPHDAGQNEGDPGSAASFCFHRPARDRLCRRGRIAGGLQHGRPEILGTEAAGPGGFL